MQRPHSKSLQRFRHTAAALILTTTLALSGCASALLWAVRAASSLDWNGQDRIELPLVRDSVGHVGIPVTINGKETTAFLDTGAATAIMNPETAELTGVRVKSMTETAGMARTIPVQMGPALLEISLALATEGLRDTPFVLGAEFFSLAVVDMDIAAGRVTLIRPDAFVPPAAEPMEVDLNYARPIVDVRIEGHKKPICTVIDTGSPFGLALDTELARKLALPTVPGRTIRYSRIDGEVKETPVLAPLEEIRIGKRTFHNVPAFGQVERKGRDCGTLLGMAVLSRFHLIFDIKRSRMWLLPP